MIELPDSFIITKCVNGFIIQTPLEDNHCTSFSTFLVFKDKKELAEYIEDNLKNSPTTVRSEKEKIL